jgi:aspartate beta-hydroxylase
MSDISAARRLLQSRQLAAAERAYEAVLDAMPDNTEALNVVALGCLRTGRTSRALELLERAAASDPHEPATQHHLGQAYHAIGDLTRAAAANATASRLDPGFFVARLAWGRCLEQLGRLESAIIQYKRALDDAQKVGHWLGPESTPDSLQPLVSHAVLAVRQGRRAAFDTLLKPLIETYGRGSMVRVERCLRIYLNEEPPVYVDPRQRPSFLLFPDLPTSPYLDLAQFPWIESLQASTGVIRDELNRLLPSASGSERVFASDALEAENLRGIDATPSWNGYYFWRHGLRREDNCLKSPETFKALERLPLPKIREHGPEVMFSVFTPGTYLMPHRGVTNSRVVGHLPLIVPEDCALRVGGEVHEWVEGRVVVFDDTYEHDAWNRSGSTRVVLIFDLWHPDLTDAERAAITDLVGQIGDFRSAVVEA